MVFALHKPSSPNSIVGPGYTSERRGGEKKGAVAISHPPLQLFYGWDPLPAVAASAMAGEADNQRSVLELMAVFEEHW